MPRRKWAELREDSQDTRIAIERIKIPLEAMKSRFDFLGNYKSNASKVKKKTTKNFSVADSLKERSKDVEDREQSSAVSPRCNQH